MRFSSRVASAVGPRGGAGSHGGTFFSGTGCVTFGVLIAR